jgi:hypothetical protein
LPSGLGTLSAQETGTRIDRKVYVDGNGDGNVKDNDLKPNQKRALEASYRDSILANDGKNFALRIPGTQY